jgi:two-component system sensor histidine kinase CiaH
MNNLFRSAIFKLTFFYLGLVMIICLLFSGVIFQLATQEVAAGLRSQTARIYQQYPVFTGDPFLHRENEIITSSHHLLLNLFLLNGCVFFTAGFASYWLARRTLAPIESANNQQKRFVADVSHELRTPLTALKMETEVALMDTAASASNFREALTSNLEEAVKLETLLNNLLRLSRLESDELIQTFTPISAHTIVHGAIIRIKRQADAKHITIDDTSTNEIIQGDQESLIELVTIILENALKYSPTNSSIVITTKTDGKEVVLSVCDHGIGIESEALDHVFDRFYRAETARSSEGHGLGLSIAKQIADLHHSTITLKSTAGKGTTAMIHFPITVSTE